MSGLLNVVGNTTLSNLQILKDANLAGVLNVVGNTTLSNLTVNGTAQINGSLGVSGSITASSFNATSDRRLKMNIVCLQNQVNEILKIQPVSFKWAPDGRDDYGFIAQDVYNTYPILRPAIGNVDPNSSLDEPLDKNGNPIYYSMDYGRMTPFLWQGLREIIKRIECLETENVDLKRRISLLEK
jgi:hypothetical protein